MSPSPGASLEDRLRAHYAARAVSEPLPGPPTDEALLRLDRGERAHPLRAVASPVPNRPSWSRRHRGLLAAAAVTVAVLAAGAVVVTEDTGDPVATDPSPVAPAPTPTPTEDSAPDPTPPASEAPLATEPGGPAGPFVAYEGVLGTWDGTRWVQWTPGAPTSGGDFTLVHLDEPLATVAGTSASVPCSPDATPGIDLGLDLPAAARATAPIGVAGVADPRPRPVEVLDPGDSTYAVAVDEAIAGRRITGETPAVRQVVRGDIDGDGVPEELIAAERTVPGGVAAAGVTLENDIAGLFVRRHVGDTTLTTAVDWMSPLVGKSPYPEAYRVAALADLNGDGRMEVVVDLFWYESISTAVYEVRPDGTFTRVLEASCGA